MLKLIVLLSYSVVYEKKTYFHRFFSELLFEILNKHCPVLFEVSECNVFKA